VTRRSIRAGSYPPEDYMKPSPEFTIKLPSGKWFPLESNGLNFIKREAELNYIEEYKKAHKLPINWRYLPYEKWADIS